MEIGERLRVARLDHNLSQEELAEALGATSRSVRRWERGEVVPHAYYRARYCRLFELSREALFGSDSDATRLLQPFPICQLPSAIGDFTGRDVALGEVRSLLEDQASRQPHALPILVITGRAGVGKTTLAVRAAHELGCLFPDGQLYVSLREAGQPLEAAKLLERLLRTLGVESSALPESLEERTRLYRGRLSGRRLLVVLDDAASEAQVRPLLPGEAGCVALVTSRSRLVGIEGARRVELELLSREQAVELLSRVAGRGRVETELEAAVEIVETCGRLPLALRIAGARLAARPHWKLRRMARQLGDEHRRLDELAQGDLDVRASLMLSYRGLSEDERRAFRLLGLMEAEDFAAGAAGALLEVEESQAEELLEGLVEARLLEVVGEDAAGQARYRLHDLLRMLALERTREEEGPEGERAALKRLLTGFLEHTLEAEAEVPGQHARWSGGRQSEAGSMEWFKAEHTGIVAAIERAHALGLDELACDLTCAASPAFMLHGHFDDLQRALDLALRSAQRAGHVRGEGWVRYWLGAYLRSRMRVQLAVEQIEDSRRLFVEAGDRRGESYAVWTLGAALHGTGRLVDGMQRLEQSRRMFVELHDDFGHAWSLFDLGFCHLECGRHQEAVELLERSIEGFYAVEARCPSGPPQSWRRSWCWFGEGYALWCLGTVHAARSQLQQAVRCLQRSADLFGEIGYSFGRALALLHLGTVDRMIGHTDAAMSCLVNAFEAFTALADRFNVAAAEYELGLLHQDLGAMEEALGYYDRCLVVFAEFGLGEFEARTLRSIADLLASTDAVGAREKRDQACRIQRRQGLGAAYELARVIGGDREAADQLGGR